MKTYTHKLYDIQGNYIRVLSDNIVFPSFGIESSINSGVATYSFTIDKEYDSPLEDNEYLLVVTEYGPNNKTGRTVFAGTIDNIGGTLGDDENTIKYNFGGLHRLLNSVKMSMSAYSGQKVKDLVQDVVDYFNTKYPISSVLLGGDLIKNGVTDETLITKTGSSIDMTCLSLLSDIFKIAGQTFYFKADGTIVGGPKPTTASHKFMTKKDILSLDVQRKNISDIINRVRVGGIRYEDAGSITLYGPKENIESIDTTHLPTLENFADKFLEEHAYGKREISIEIMTSDYSNVYPGQTIGITNTRLDNVSNLQVIKTSYDGYKMKIYLEKYTSLAKLIAN